MQGMCNQLLPIMMELLLLFEVPRWRCIVTLNIALVIFNTCLMGKLSLSLIASDIQHMFDGKVELVPYC